MVQQCQVVERGDKWPYIAPCREKATNSIRLWVRQNNPDIDVEYICEMHAQKCVDAFGANSVEGLK